MLQNPPDGGFFVCSMETRTDLINLKRIGTFNMARQLYTVCCQYKKICMYEGGVSMSRVQTAVSSRADQEDVIRKMVFAGIFAAITYVVFTFLSIPVPTVGGGKVTVHLGNAFCVLGVLLLGSAYGGVGGALGLTIADLLDPVYIVEAPITFLIKLLMGILVGVIAHRMGHISTQNDHRKVLTWTVAASLAGLVFNAFLDPTIRYFYKILILGKPAAQVSFAVNFTVTAINSAVSAVICVALYMALRVPLKKMGLFFRL